MLKIQELSDLWACMHFSFFYMPPGFRGDRSLSKSHRNCVYVNYDSHLIILVMMIYHFIWVFSRGDLIGRVNVKGRRIILSFFAGNSFHAWTSWINLLIRRSQLFSDWIMMWKVIMICGIWGFHLPGETDSEIISLVHFKSAFFGSHNGVGLRVRNAASHSLIRDLPILFYHSHESESMQSAYYCCPQGGLRVLQDTHQTST